MAELFSEDWMGAFKDRWNADGELSGALAKIGFNSTIAYGFDEESGNFQEFNYTGVIWVAEPVK